MHQEVLAPATAKCLDLLNQKKIISPFYLGGGTAVALHLGHRQSEDLDFFSPENFPTLQLRQKLSKLGNYILDEEKPGTLHGALNKVKLSFLEYPYPLLGPTPLFNGVPVAALEDLAAMKLDAVASRGKKRDFIDLYFLSQEKFSLKEILAFYEKKFSGLQVNMTHVLKGLTYFDDAEGDPDPIFFKVIPWEKIKRYFLREAPRSLPLI